MVETNLVRANLELAVFWKANLSNACLAYSYLVGADLTDTNLTEFELRGAELTRANLKHANLRATNLRDANLEKSNLRDASFINANLLGANLKNAYLSDTSFGNVDLSKAFGLDEIQHQSPSTIGINTIQLSRGQIPTVFLRGCGLPDWEIEAAKLHVPDLSNEDVNKILYKMYDLRASQALQIFLFISYSHGDSSFVEKLEDYLNDKGIRFWRDIHHATAGG